MSSVAPVCETLIDEITTNIFMKIPYARLTKCISFKLLVVIIFMYVKKKFTYFIQHLKCLFLTNKKKKLKLFCLFKSLYSFHIQYFDIVILANNT